MEHSRHEYGSWVTQNELLGSLTGVDREAMALAVRPVGLRAGTVLYRPGDWLDHVYLPCRCLISRVLVQYDGTFVEVGTTGRDGLVEMASCLRSSRAQTLCIVRVEGPALRVDASVLRSERRRRSSLDEAIARYEVKLLRQTEQAIACGTRHSLGKRLARTLLVAGERTGRDEFEITHEALGAMLAVRRQAVSEAAAHLRSEGLIDYARGKLRILDRSGLARSACECYPASGHDEV